MILDFYNASERNPLHLIEGDLIVAPIIEPGGPRRLMAGHLLGDLQLAAVLQVGGDHGGAEAVGADFGSQSCSACPPLDHHVHIGLGQGSAIRQPTVAQGSRTLPSSPTDAGDGRVCLLIRDRYIASV